MHGTNVYVITLMYTIHSNVGYSSIHGTLNYTCYTDVYIQINVYVTY